MRFIRNLLNRFGYYKLDQLQVGGHCGFCGKTQPKEITVIEDDGWTICDVCIYDFSNQ